MSVPENYAKRIRGVLGATAVWIPGTKVKLGAIMQREDSQFKQIGHLSKHTDVATVEDNLEQSLDLVSQGTRQRLFQANAELPGTAALDLSAQASVKFEFTKEFGYALKTPTLTGQHITNLDEVAAAVFQLPKWKHKEFFLVHEILNAKQFSFLWSQQSGSKVELSGKGSAILDFLSAGVSVGLAKTGKVDLEMLGESGSLAMALVRITSKGDLDFVTK